MADEIITDVADGIDWTADELTVLAEGPVPEQTDNGVKDEDPDDQPEQTAEAVAAWLA